MEYLVTLDKDTIFRFEVGEIHPRQGRYLNALRATTIQGDDVIKTLVDPNNLLSDHIYAPGGGLLVLNDYQEHDLRVRISDEHGNRSTLTFKVRRDDSLETSLSAVAAAIESDEDVQRIAIPWYLPHLFIDDGVTYTLPAASLYDSGWFPMPKWLMPTHLQYFLCRLEIWEIPRFPCIPGEIFRVFSSGLPSAQRPALHIIMMVFFLMQVANGKVMEYVAV